jgi:hypothetical protein
MPDVVIYVHGVVGRVSGAHTADYRTIHKGLRRAGVRLPSLTDSVSVEWGWPTPEAPFTGDLALAQERLALALAQSPQGDRLSGFLVNPLRQLIQYGWSDLVYYSSAEGEAAARHDAWSQILERVPTGEAIDLTIISHSLGSLLAHDFLFYLFSGQRQAKRSQVCSTASQWNEAQVNWRLRRLVTMGSPLGPLLVRAPGFVKRLAHEPPPWLDPADIGLADAAHSGARPVWLNVWDRHDVVSFPVSGIYGAGDRIRDLYPDVSDWPPRAHGRYWKSRKVHKTLARFWDA